MWSGQDFPAIILGDSKTCSIRTCRLNAWRRSNAVDIDANTDCWVADARMSTLQQSKGLTCSPDTLDCQLGLTSQDCPASKLDKSTCTVTYDR